jgi:hypothetical protein
MYRTSLLVIGLTVFAAACSDSPSGPSDSSGTTTTSTFTVPLLSANEVPPVTSADASGSGVATIALHVTKDASGSVIASTADFQISVTGFPAGARVTDAHIHNGGPGQNASVFVSVGLGSGELALTNGAGSITKNGVSVPSDKLSAILSNPGSFYFNVHTALNPDGAIRGQLAGGGASVVTGEPVPY